MNFQEFCKAAGAAQPTQGLGFAYNYAVAITQILEDSFCDEPTQFTTKNGACVVTCRSDSIEFKQKQLQAMLAALKEAEFLSFRRENDEFIMSAAFRV